MGAQGRKLMTIRHSLVIQYFFKVKNKTYLHCGVLSTFQEAAQKLF